MEKTLKEALEEALTLSVERYKKALSREGNAEAREISVSILNLTQALWNVTTPLKEVL